MEDWCKFAEEFNKLFHSRKTYMSLNIQWINLNSKCSLPVAIYYLGNSFCSFCVLNSFSNFSNFNLCYWVTQYHKQQRFGLFLFCFWMNINRHYCNVLWQMVGSFFFLPFPSSATLYGYSSRCKIIVGLRARKYLLRSILGAPQMDCQDDGFSVLPTQRQVWSSSNWQSPDAEAVKPLPLKTRE